MERRDPFLRDRVPAGQVGETLARAGRFSRAPRWRREGARLAEHPTVQVASGDRHGLQPLQSSNVAGSTATYTFTGSYVAWVTEKDPAHGQAVVSIDGVATPLTDNYNAGTLPRRVMAVSALPAGTHTIRVTVLATKASAATDTRTDIDAFIVLGVP